MIAMSPDEEEHPQPPWLSCLHSGRSRQDLMEGVYVDTMKWPNPTSCGAAALLRGARVSPPSPHPPAHVGRARGE